MKQKQYPQYKESHIDFIGQIPSHWETRRLKFNVSKVGSGITPRGGAESYESEGIPLLRSQNVHFDGLRLDDVVYISEEMHKDMSNSQVAAGDVLLNITGASIGRCYFVDENLGEANVNQHVCIIRPEHGLLTGFLNYIMASEIGQRQIDLDQTGSGREGLNFLALKNFSIPIVNEKEQQTIVNFLDWKTGQIDELISKKKQLIEKLKEKRTAMITQAVTKGLNPDATMRDSGIPWLGEVPEHWKVLSIKRLTPVSRGASPRPIEDPKYFDDEGEYAWVRIADVTSNDHYLRETTQRLSELGKSLSVPLEPGSLFLSIAGSVGKPMMTAIKACIHDGFVYFPQLQINPEYLFYIFESGQPYLGLGKLGTQLNLNTDTVGNIKIGLPENDEQRAIVDFLDLELSHLDELVAKNNQLIEKLTEYRTALITAATTGKIDVRNVKIGGAA